MQPLPILLFGAGGVGRALLSQIVATRRFHAQEYGVQIQVLGVCDRNGGIFASPNGLSDTQLHELIALKQAGGALSSLAQGQSLDTDRCAAIDGVACTGLVVVDCSATDDTTPALLHARALGHAIVLANKKPLTTSQEIYQQLTRSGGAGSPLQPGRVRWETTVGAGLPVIATENRLVASGDAIHKIAGTFSGTLGYVMTGLQEGRRFSEIVIEAKGLGFTEPDPRDDLGGVDVARKALILARGLGWTLEMDDVSVIGLYPPSMDDLSVEQFMAALPDLDAQFAAEVSAAAESGQVMRYAATVEEGRCSVGPRLVDAASPLGRLSGTDNLVELHSRWYSPNPLVIYGRGAGVEATAAGVLSDIVELGYTV